MAKRTISWTFQAQMDRREILDYWIKRNKSTTYSKKLDRLWREAAEFVAINPNAGRRTNVEGVRARRVRNYYLLYEYSSKDIQILTIWDCHQSPDKLEFTLEG